MTQIGQQLDFIAANVFRIRDAPWSLVLNTSSITVGAPLSVPVDARLLLDTTPPAGPVVDVGAFRLESGSNQNWQVTVDKELWSFPGGPYRNDVVTAFTSFLQQVQALEGTRLEVGATEVLRTLLAPRIPATFAESLFFAMGFLAQDNPPRCYVDLAPGMRLRIDFQQRQFLPSNFPGPLSGFVGGASVTTTVSSVPRATGGSRLTLDPFLSAARLPALPPSTGGAGGLIDLAATSAAVRHLRLCYPPGAFVDAASGGVATPQGNVTLLGADDLTSLATATTAYYTSGHPSAALVAYFRGRATVVPELPCFVDSSLRYVPLAATFRHVLEPFGVLSRLPNLLDVDGVRSISGAYRRHVPGIDVNALFDTQSRFLPVRVLDVAGTDATGSDMLDFPVLPRDALDTSTIGPGHG
jgi:hypothetical protein